MHQSQLLVFGTLWAICFSSLTILPAAGQADDQRGEAAEVVNLWPGNPPGEAAELEPEHDATKPTDHLIAGERLMRITNVSTPTLTVFRPADESNTGAAVVVCPGGGHHVLAWDLEGTEVAQWLNSLGVTAIVLKYRVPARDLNRRWLAAVQDAQRAVSFVRSKADALGVDPDRIGVLGFSAGGQTAGLAALLSQRQYEPVDAIDEVSFRPDFAVLVYPAGFHDRQSGEFPEEVEVTEASPPMFLVHAHDDRLSPENSVQLYLRLKRAGVPAELHVYSTGGHGFGLRRTTQPVTSWPDRCAEWLQQDGWLSSR